MNDDVGDRPKQRRGFALLSPDKRSQIASKGGSSVPADKRSFSRDKYLASAAGAKGGRSSRDARRTER